MGSEILSITATLAPWLLLGAAIAGLLHRYLPPSWMQRHLRGRWGVAKAVALGVPLPLCSCGVIPAGLGLRKGGASDGATLGFLISTPQTGVDSILVSATFLGWPFALYKVAAAAVTGMVGGWLADVPASEAPDITKPAELDESIRPTWSEALSHSVDLLRSIWGWLVFGIIVSAAISAYVPAGELRFDGAAGPILGALAVLLISLPLYVCATASVPIAAAMVAAGLPPGSALIFLMAGPATNIATLGAVRGAFGARTTAIYVSVIVLGSVGFAWLFDGLLGAGGHVAAHAHEHGGPSLIGLTSTGILIALLGYFAWAELRGQVARVQFRRAQSAEIEFPVDGLTCSGCVKKLQAALLAVEGVEAAVVGLDPPRARVVGTADGEVVRRAALHAGFAPH